MAKPDPLVTATRYVAQRHPDALAAFLGGSVARGEGTDTSDLDLVILTTAPPAPYRETVVFEGWIVETFVHSDETIRLWTEKDVGERTPALARMCTEGPVLVDRGPGSALRDEMRRVLEAGPPPMSAAELEQARYGIADSMDDLADSPPGLERLWATAMVVSALVRLELEVAGRWSGTGKGAIRRLAEAEPERAAELETAAIAAADDPNRLVELGNRWLAPYGGRLTDGYRADGSPILDAYRRSRATDAKPSEGL